MEKEVEEKQAEIQQHSQLLEKHQEEAVNSKDEVGSLKGQIEAKEVEINKLMENIQRLNSERDQHGADQEGA